MPERKEVTRAAQRVVDALEKLIVTGELLPGQPIRQEEMAERLGVSRLPIREALRQLSAEGLVQHVHNVGYTVARLQQSDFDQIYLMRAALEREVIATIGEIDDETLAVIREQGNKVTDAAERGDVLDMRVQNQAFHFAIFEQSPLYLVIAELRRLWTMAMPYHAAYLYDPEVRRRVVAEHDEMIAALAEHDNDRLIALMNEHRRGGEASTGNMLRATGSTPTHPPRPEL